MRYTMSPPNAQKKRIGHLPKNKNISPVLILKRPKYVQPGPASLHLVQVMDPNRETIKVEDRLSVMLW